MNTLVDSNQICGIERLIYDEEFSDIKKTSYKNIRIFYRQIYKELVINMLSYIKKYKIPNISNKYGERVWKKGCQFIPLQFVNCVELNTSLVIMNQSQISTWQELCIQLRIQALVLLKPKEFQELQKKQNIHDYLSTFDIIITIPSRIKEIQSLLQQQTHHLVHDNNERQQYQQYLLQSQQIKQTQEDVKLVKYLLDIQTKGLLLENSDFVTMKQVVTGKIFQRVILDPSAYQDLTTEVIGKIQWYLTTDHKFEMYQFGRKMWKDFYSNNSKEVINNIFINGLSFDISSINRQLIQFIYKKYDNEAKKRLPINQTTNFETGDDDSLVNQIDLFTYSKADFPLFVQRKIQQTDQNIQTLQQNPQVNSEITESWNKVRNNVLLNINNIQDKFDEKDQEICPICCSSSKNTKVYFMCCFYQMCIQCFTKIANDKKPLLQCILCKFRYNSIICKNLIFIKHESQKTKIIKKQDIIDDICKIYKNNVVDIDNLRNIPNTQLSVTGYLDINQIEHTNTSESLNEKQNQVYIKVLKFINKFNLYDKSIKIYIIGSNMVELQQVQ